ncbi:hypothetical protein, partial [Enterococcus faecium]
SDEKRSRPGCGGGRRRRLADVTRPGTTPPRRLLASIHDVSPRHEPAIDRLLEELASVGVARPAMLVVPDFWREAEIR